MAPSAQLPCPVRDQGCRRQFVKATGLIQHFENNECRVVSAKRFAERIQRKEVDRVLQAHTDQFIRKLETLYRSNTPANDDMWDEEPGGVPLPSKNPQGSSSAQQTNDLSLYEKASMTQWYNPESTQYDVRFFWHNRLQIFCCPFPYCNLTFKDRKGMQTHVEATHYVTFFKCSFCKNRFKLASALVGHIESTEKCKVRRSIGVHDLLEIISGGFVQPEDMRGPTVILSRKDLELVDSDAAKQPKSIWW
ncbi:hypothetical protein K470DRAFT_270634 [Piedraia hortae CBS 480.64]|uniref:C2H2-type domain-containing protein n=1 Tax=Piedraia hortae CBS 480.64 TaxID=1314780 RepID=A0A6A7BZC3_9PEZI|nr:hypothetical protein K470DRAFT_270634 [Piedraia hortae CBS 480.64]